MIGGNATATIQLRTTTTKNDIGEAVPVWENVMRLKGWVDLAGGEAKYLTYNAKIQESTHIFICDYNNMIVLGTEWEWNDLDFRYSFINKQSRENIRLQSDNARIIVGGQKYDVMLIDDPMGLHKQLEIYLKLTGGQ